MGVQVTPLEGERACGSAGFRVGPYGKTLERRRQLRQAQAPSVDVFDSLPDLLLQRPGQVRPATVVIDSRGVVPVIGARSTTHQCRSMRWPSAVKYPRMSTAGIVTLTKPAENGATS